jgi:hypothetical protein
MKLSLAAAFFAFAVAACGGKSKPAAETTPPAVEEGDGPVADCCCDFIEETPIGDDGEDTAENQVYRMMSKAECEGQSGTCGADTASCDGGGAAADDEESVGD